MARRALSKKTRFDVFKRDGFVCQYCGAHPPAVILHVDHIHPVAEGGDNDTDNLITACEPCNLGKGARKLSVAPESLSDKAARIAEAEAQLAGWTAVLEAKRERLEDEAWEVVYALTGKGEIRRDHLQSVKRFVERLGVSAVIDAAEIARARTLWSESKTFKYFCGVCWGKIREAGGEV
jgi:hypothetical protein